MPRFLPGFLTAFSALLLIACNSTDSGTASGGSGLSARIDGKAWEAEPVSVVAQVNAGVPGSLMILGTQTMEGKSKSLTITLYNVSGPGKYALGVSISTIGGTGQWGEGTGSGGDANSWITPNSGVAGEVEITSLGDGRIQGTFSFACQPGRENATGENRDITEGKFNLALKGTLSPLEENAGSKVTAEMDGVFYNADFMTGSLKDFTGGAGFTFSSTSSLHGVSINLVGVTAPGTYALGNISPQRLMTAGRTGGTAANCCWGTMPGDSGEIIVTSMTARRVKGTFSARLKPQANRPATADLVITNGTFDIGIP